MIYVEAPNMIYVEAPSAIYSDSSLPVTPRLFLAGSITGAKDWQESTTTELSDTQCIIYNPRRKVFGPDVSSQEQIEWEFNALRSSNIIVFYFSSETLAPITLFEYGAALERVANGWTKNKHIVVYCEPDYKRREDVFIQTELMKLNDKVTICHSLYEFHRTAIKKIEENIAERNIRYYGKHQ